MWRLERDREVWVLPHRAAVIDVLAGQSDNFYTKISEFDELYASAIRSRIAHWIADAIQARHLTDYLAVTTTPACDATTSKLLTMRRGAEHNSRLRTVRRWNHDVPLVLVHPAVVAGNVLAIDSVTEDALIASTCDASGCTVEKVEG